MDKAISRRQEDVLTEIGNIGMGNAASSLSELLKEQVRISVPSVDIVSLGDLPYHMGGAADHVVGIYVPVHGDVSMHMIFILPVKSASVIVLNITDGLAQEMDELGQSAIAEVGNIVVAGYVNAFAHLTDLRLLLQPPVLAIDITEAILGSVLAGIQIPEDFVINIKASFETGSSKAEGYLCMIPAEDSFPSVYEALLEGLGD